MPEFMKGGLSMASTSGRFAASILYKDFSDFKAGTEFFGIEEETGDFLFAALDDDDYHYLSENDDATEKDIAINRLNHVISGEVS